MTIRIYLKTMSYMVRGCGLDALQVPVPADQGDFAQPGNTDRHAGALIQVPAAPSAVE